MSICIGVCYNTLFQQVFFLSSNRNPIWRVWTLSSKTTNTGWSCFWMSWGWVTFFNLLINYLLTLLHKLRTVSTVFGRTSLNSLKPQSTLGRTCLGTCPGTWLRCMRSVPHTQTSSGRWATRGEHSRSESDDMHSYACNGTILCCHVSGDLRVSVGT